jgi:hypothetical protein
MTFHYAYVNVDEIIPIFPLPSPEKFTEDYRAVGTPEDWALKCGSKIGHDRKTCQAIAELVVRGTAKMPETDEEFELVKMTLPGAVRSSWWIFAQSSEIGDDALYAILFKNMALGFLTGDGVSADDNAYFLLKAIEIEVEKVEHLLAVAHLQAKGGGKQGGKGSGPANPTAKGGGKDRGQKGKP